MLLARVPVRAWRLAAPRRVAAAAAAAASPDPLLLLLGGARITAVAHEALRQVVGAGDTVVDATAGNGSDAVFLAERVGAAGRVLAFDVLPEALAATRAAVEAAIPPAERPALEYVEACHSRLGERVAAGSLAAAVFNLGYLPRGGRDEYARGQEVATQAATTVAAVEAALAALRPGGLLAVCAYRGHAGGAEEEAAVAAVLAALSTRRWTTSRLELLNRAASPVLMLAQRARTVPK